MQYELHRILTIIVLTSSYLFPFFYREVVVVSVTEQSKNTVIQLEGYVFHTIAPN